MRVTVSAKVFDISGVLSFEALHNNEVGIMLRRTNRVAVLDGSVAVNNSGFSHGDRDMDFIYKPVSSDHDDIARRLVTEHSRVYVSTSEGCFEAIPGPFAPGPENNRFTLQIIDKVSED